MIRLALLATGLLLGAVGCAYTSGEPTTRPASGGYSWGSLYRQDVRTVAVPIFTTRSFHRGVEFDVSRSVVQQIESLTPYKVVPREKADTLLEGEVVDVALSTVSSESRSAIPQEQLYRITVNFTWKDLRSGQILVERRNFEQQTTFYPTLGEGRFVGRQQGAESLARGIVQELQADW